MLRFPMRASRNYWMVWRRKGGRSKDLTTENCKPVYKYEQRIVAVFEVKSGIEAIKRELYDRQNAQYWS